MSTLTVSFTACVISAVIAIVYLVKVRKKKLIITSAVISAPALPVCIVSTVIAVGTVAHDDISDKLVIDGI